MKAVDKEELLQRIQLNYERLADSAYYQIEEVFSPTDYEWYGDKEGRALLAFVSHYKINGRKIACMEQMMNVLPEKLNSKGYLGAVSEKLIYEQQLSGHSWLLRGLCEYYELWKEASCLEMIRKMTENLYLPLTGQIVRYPLQREAKIEGGVSGTSTAVVENWILSSDIGCAFMSIDGLAHVYQITKMEKVKTLLDEMIFFYLSIDKVKLQAQTHCTLTAARGMLRMYSVTGDQRYLDGAKEIMVLYVHGGGMTHTWQNLNWWGRPDSWTEPCAIVDSLMVALELYKITGETQYRTCAARIYHNGLATAQRSNGGAGTDSIVSDDADTVLYAKMYEAYFCCTMRLAEGLWYINENAEFLYAETSGQVVKNYNRYMDGDLLYAEVSANLEPYAEEITEIDGHRLCPLVKYYKVPEDVVLTGWQKVVF